MESIVLSDVTALVENEENQQIVTQVASKLRGRLDDFWLDEVGGELILHGAANSYHVKQLAQHEVMNMTCRPIRRNQIVVNY